MKKLIILLCGLAAILSASAQTSVTVSEPRWVNPADKVIIQEYSSHYPATITCSSYEDSLSTLTTFIYSSGSMQATEVSISGYYVNDMVLGLDSVFFCGRDIRTQRGVIGYFDINDVFFGSGQIHILSNFVAGENQYDIINLTRLVKYFEDNGRVSHVACIGLCDGEEERIYPCLIDLIIDLPSTYKAGVVRSEKEEFTDIKRVRTGLMVDDYHLVTTGFDLQYGRYINIRVYKPGDVFSTSGLQDMCHVYSVDTGYVRPWLDGGVLLTDVGDYTFATVSYRMSAKQKPERAEYTDTIQKIMRNIHLAYFRINPIINNSVYGMTENYEIPFGGATDCVMERIVNSASANTLAFLHTYRHNIPSVTESAYCEVKRSALAASGVFQAYSNPGISQAGLSLYNSQQCYVLSGFELSSPTNLEYQMNTFGILSNCAEPKDYSYEKLNPVASWNFSREFSVIAGVSMPVSVGVEPWELPLIKKCEK